jgi:endonuclease/exonuclease/phosphatase family metal-dependent hydrolase
MTTFTVMTWNVENLFTPSIDAEVEEHITYAFKLNLIANVIAAADPDVIGLQEVGGEEPLNDLQMALNNTYPNRIVSAFPDNRGIRVAFLTRHEITKVEDIADFPAGPATEIFSLTSDNQSIPINRMSRGALLIRVKKDDLEVYVINAHLKSKLLTFRREGGGASFSPRDEFERAQVGGIALHKRTAEAVTLRHRVNLLLENQSGTPLILLGDMNDVPDAQTSLLLLGPTGSELGTRGFNRPDQGDDARLFNLAAAIPEERRYSRIHHSREELLDQILASEELFPRNAAGDRAIPFADSLVDFAEGLDSIGDNPNLRVDKVPPDHAPVVARFQV